MPDGPCSQHVTGNTSRLNQPQSALCYDTYQRTYDDQGINVAIWMTPLKFGYGKVISPDNLKLNYLLLYVGI